jgi:hypothetical protein
MKTEDYILQFGISPPGVESSWPRIEVEGGVFYALVNLGPFSQTRIALHGIASQSEAMQAARMLQFPPPEKVGPREYVQN